MICSARDPRCCWCGNHGRPSSLSWISSNTRFWNTEVILDSSILVILDLIINSWTFQSLIGNNEHSWGWDLGRNKIYHDRCRVSTNQTKPTITKKLTIEQPINCVCVVNKPRRMQRKLWWCFLLITGPETATSAHLNSQRNESLSPHQLPKSPSKTPDPAVPHTSPNLPKLSQIWLFTCTTIKMNVIGSKKSKSSVFQQKPVWRDLSTESFLWRDLCCAGQVSQWVSNNLLVIYVNISTAVVTDIQKGSLHQECDDSTFSRAWYGGGDSLLLCWRTISWSGASWTPGKEGSHTFQMMKEAMIFFKEWNSYEGFLKCCSKMKTVHRFTR